MLFKGLTVAEAIEQLQKMPDQKAILVDESDFGAGPITRFMAGVVYRHAKEKPYDTGCLFCPTHLLDGTVIKARQQQPAVLVDTI